MCPEMGTSIILFTVRLNHLIFRHCRRKKITNRKEEVEISNIPLQLDHIRRDLYL